jgi:hypothetical protein
MSKEEVMKIDDLVAEAKILDDERLDLERKAKMLKRQVDTLAVEIISGMQSLGVKELSGARIEEIEKPYISDYDALELYIAKNKAIDLLQKRLSESAVQLRWSDGVEIPGIGVQSEVKLRLM